MMKKRVGRDMLAKAPPFIILTLLIAGAGCANWDEFSRRAQNPYPGDPASIERGKAVYAESCVSCHGETGSGNGPQAAETKPPLPNFTDQGRMINRGDPDLFWAISRGTQQATGSHSYRSKVSGETMWDMVNYIRTLYP